MRRQLIFLVILLTFGFISPKAYSQDNSTPSKEKINVSMMSKVDAYRTKWTYECAKNSKKIRTGFLCGVEFARTVEKYDVKYKTVLRMKNEQLATKLVKNCLISTYMNKFYEGAINAADPQEKMRSVHQKAKDKLMPLEIYSNSDINEWKPREISIVE